MGAILHGRRSNLVAYLLFLLFAVGNVYAQTPTTTATPTATPEGGGGATGVLNAATKIIAQTAVLGAITIVVGLFALFFGQRFFKVTLFFAGFFVSAMVAFILMSRFEPSGGYPNRDTVLLLGSLACGIVGGGISLCLWRIGLILLGATAGFLFGMFILSWESGGVIKDGKGRIIFLAVMTALPAIFISFFQKILLVVASSIAGAYSVIFGIDCYAKTGFTDSARNFLVGADKFSFTVFARDGKVIALLCSMIALAIIGMIVQFRIFKRKDKY